MSTHVVPVRTYVAVFAGLLGLTALTTWVSFLDLGPLNTPIALAIAALKVALVILFFMHVRHSSRLVRVMSIAGFYWLLILFAFLMSDYLTRASLPPWSG
jgi:cytochrome c oxidase subunit 4